MRIPQAFEYHAGIQHITLVGLGGSGSQAARTLCRILHDLRRRRKHLPTVSFIDPDHVEDKNIGRQMFTEADLGKNKAVTLARRFNLAMGLNIIAYPEPFKVTPRSKHYGELLIGCVDNHEARCTLNAAQSLWLDCGNETHSGQVCLGNTNDLNLIKECLKKKQFRALPNAALLFPSLLEAPPAAPSTPAASCAERLEDGSQSLLVNDLVGIAAGSYLYKLLNQLPLYHFLTWLDSDSLTMRSESIDPKTIREHLKIT